MKKHRQVSGIHPVWLEYKESDESSLWARLTFYIQKIFSFSSLLVTDGTTNLLLGNHTNMLLVYQDVTLKWAAQLPFVPVAIRTANFLWVPRLAKRTTPPSTSR